MNEEVFISYKSENYETAQWIKTTLETNDISCWLAPDCIPGGSNYATVIPNAIRNCEIFVLVLSENAQLSKWVPKELDQAINENKTIMPFMLENFSLKDDFNFYLSNVQRYAAYESKHSAMEKMVREIKAILDTKKPVKVDTEAKETDSPIDKSIKDDTQIVEDSPVQEQVINKKVKSEKITEPKKHKTKAHNKSDSKEHKKEKQSISSSSKKKRLLIIPAVIILLIGVSLLINLANTVSVCGEKYKKNDTFISLNAVEITDKDVENIAKMKKISSMRFEDCTFNVGNMKDIFSSELNSLYIVNCNLSKEKIAQIDFSSLPLNTLDLSGNIGLASLDILAPLSDKLTNLNISNTSVASLKGIEAFNNLSRITATNDKIKDISPLSSCVNLTDITVDENGISDLSSLSTLEKLTSININKNSISNFSGLENCIKLSHIEAAGNKIESLSGLENTTVLSYVFLCDNNISDGSILSGSKKTLNRLYLDNNILEDITFLSGTTELDKISINHNKLTSLEPLKESVKLNGISASSNSISNLNGVTELPALRYLVVNNNAIENCGLVKFDPNNSAVFDISNNPLKKLEIDSLATFSLLNLYGTSLTDFASVQSAEYSSLVIPYSDAVNFSEINCDSLNNCTILDCPKNKQVEVTELLQNKSNFSDSQNFSININNFIPSELIGPDSYYN